MPELWADSIAQHRTLVRRRLHNAFADLVAERTFDGVTLSAVAERAGLARSAVYNYVEDKHDLVLDYTEQVVADWLDRTHEHDAEVSGPTSGAASRLEQFVRGTFVMFVTDPVAGHDLSAILRPDEARRLLAALGPIRSSLHDLVAEGVREGTFRGPAEATTQYVWAVCAGHRSALAHGQAPPEAVAAMVMDLVLHGIAAGRDAGGGVGP